MDFTINRLDGGGYKFTKGSTHYDAKNFEAFEFKSSNQTKSYSSDDLLQFVPNIKLRNSISYNQGRSMAQCFI